VCFTRWKKSPRPPNWTPPVSTGDGRRGLLLPAISEIETVGEQLDIARKKGRIEPDEPVMLQRFQVDHFEEPAA
jgi:hypothetical protein